MFILSPQVTREPLLALVTQLTHSHARSHVRAARRVPSPGVGQAGISGWAFRDSLVHTRVRAQRRSAAVGVGQ